MVSARALATIVLVIVLVVAVVVIVALALAVRPVELSVDVADVVLVGGGTAACVLARRLSERHPHLRIVVLERGVSRRDDPIVYNVKNMVTAGYAEPYSELLPTDFPGTTSAVAKMYGGGSSHNFALAVRGSRSYYDASWTGPLGLGYDELLRTYFPRVEAYHPEFSPPGDLSSSATSCETTKRRRPRPSQPLRFTSGLVQITPLPTKLLLAPRIVPAIGYVAREGLGILGKAWNVLTDSGPLRASDSFSSAVTAAVAALGGVPIVEDYNTGVAACTAASPQLFVDSVVGIRQSTDVKYLPSSYMRIDAQSRGRTPTALGVKKGDLQFVPNATVTSFDESGVAWKDGEGRSRSTRVISRRIGKGEGRKDRKDMKGRVIVCAGGIYSPYLLLKSGFDDHGSLGIGQGLKAHYGFSIVLAVEANASETFVFSAGPISFVPRVAGGHSRDWQVIVEAGPSQALIDASGGVPGQTSSTVAFSVLLWNLRPRTSGTITVGASGPTVSLRMYEDGDLSDPDSDASVIVDGMRWLTRELVPRLAQTYPSMRLVYPTQAAVDRNESEELLGLARTAISLTDHYSCTCAAGRVVDGQTFLLRGTSNVHVVDASVLPVIPDGNTNYATITVAEVAADRISALL
jgi:choline dehydrogenase-like flavoprotein